MNKSVLKQTLLCVGIILVAVLVYFSSNSRFTTPEHVAATPSALPTPNVKTGKFENEQMGVSFIYPSDWKLDEYKNGLLTLTTPDQQKEFYITVLEGKDAEQEFNSAVLEDKCRGFDCNSSQKLPSIKSTSLGELLYIHSKSNRGEGWHAIYYDKTIKKELSFFSSKPFSESPELIEIINSVKLDKTIWQDPNNTLK